MNVLELFQTFQTQEQAVEYLEQVRWRGRPVCPYCRSEKVGQHASGDRAGQRWQCRDCTRAFAVTVGTMFHGTHMPLRQWFFVLALMLNTKTSASAYQIARDTGIRRATVWSMMQRIHTAMAADEDESRLLHGIVKFDGAHVAGKRRQTRNRDEDGNGPSKPGRGTSNKPIFVDVERGQRIVTQVAEPGDRSDKGIAKPSPNENAKSKRITETISRSAATLENRSIIGTAPLHDFEYYPNSKAQILHDTRRFYSRIYTLHYIARLFIERNIDIASRLIINSGAMIVGA